MIETDLNSLWFLLITISWLSYFFLEGFDFGVGVLLPFVGRDDLDRRVAIRTIGPVWDGNEVWLIAAGAITFAAFPEWYATLFSGFYLPLFLILVALILRGVAFEFRAKDRRPQWRAWWDRAIFFGSAVPALLWGVAFANIVRGVPIDAAFEYTGGFWNLLNPYALLGGLTTLLLFTLHGATFLGLKASGPVAERAHRYGTLLALPTVAVAGGFISWTLVEAADGNRGSIGMGALIPVAVVAAAAALAVVALLRAKRDGWAFVATGVTIVSAVLMLFMTLYPRVMPSSTAAANTLDIYNAASTPMTLRVMTVIALITLPVVMAYQAWSYWVFRKRVTREQLSPTG